MEERPDNKLIKEVMDRLLPEHERPASLHRHSPPVLAAKQFSGTAEDRKPGRVMRLLAMLLLGLLSACQNLAPPAGETDSWTQRRQLQGLESWQLRIRVISATSRNPTPRESSGSSNRSATTSGCGARSMRAIPKSMAAPAG
ncbi:MAG: hypothetical protein ACE37N_11630 [Pseudohongiellaceae bacterium]